MIFLLSCVFTGSLNAPNNDGNKKAIKKDQDCAIMGHKSTGPALLPSADV